MPGPLLPDRDEMLKFVDVMFKNAHSEGFISLRIFPDKGSKNDKPLLIQSLRLDDYQFEELLLIPVELAANWNPPPAVFAPPVCTFKNRHSAKTENILEGIVLSVECDATPNTARGLLEALLGPATIVVESGGEWVNSQTGEIERKVHLHWRLKQAAATLEELAALYEARGLATALVGADTSCISIVHPLRWPGSWHCKATPKLARIAAISEDTEIDLATVLATLREAARKAGHAAPGRAPSAGNGAHGPAGGSGQPVHRSIIAQALAVIPNDSALLDAKGIQLHGWNFWNTVGMTIWASTGGSEEGRALFHEWSAKAAIYNEANTNSRWDHFATSPPSRLSFGSLVYRARQVDPDWEYQHVDPALVASIGKFLAEMELEHDEADDEGDDTEDAAAPGGGTGTSSGTSSGTGTGTSNSSQTEPTDLWGKFDPPDFPLGQVPKVIEDFALDRAATQGADVSGFAVGALAVCAGTITDEIKLQPKRHDTEWRESARLWVLKIGDPSTMKTPMIKAATKALRETDSRLAHDYQIAMARWREAAKDERGPEPAKRRAMIFDTTIEATQEILRDSPAGVLLEDDELSGWFDAMYKYSGPRGAQKDRSFWLQAYNGGAKTIDRVGRGTVHIPNLSLSIAGASAPGPIRKIASMGEDDGLLQRFNPVMLRAATGGRDEPPGQAVTNYRDLIERLHRLQAPLGYAVLKFDGGALQIREELERKHLEWMQSEWFNRKLASHIGKYNGMFARLCVIFHCVEYVQSTPPLIGAPLPLIVTEDTARRVADFLHGFLLKHAVAFYGSVVGLSNDHERLTNIADYILAHGLKEVTNRDVARGDRSMRGLKRNETDAIFEQLEALGWVTIVPSRRRGAPPQCVVNPLVHQRFAEHAKAAKERRERGRELVEIAVSAAKGPRVEDE